MLLPGFKVAGLIRVRTIFGVNFFIDIDERGRDGLRVGDGKGKAVRGTGRMIGVLAENDNFDAIQIGREGTENLNFGRENTASFVGGMKKLT